MAPVSGIDLRRDKGSIRGLELAGLPLDLENALGVPVDLIPTGCLDDGFRAFNRNDEALLYAAS